MTTCDDLPRFDGKNMGDLLQHDVSTINTYGQCSLKLKTLQQWVSEN